MAATPDYIKDRRHANARALRAALGGRCAKCGATGELHFHHRDPSEKAFQISGNLTASFDRLIAEARKCELLCPKCHRNEHRTSQHGALRMYSKYKCRCDECRTAWNAATQAYREKKKCLQTRHHVV